MKNCIKLSLVLLFVFTFIFSSFASGIWCLIPSNNSYIYLKEDKKPYFNSWAEIDGDNDGYKEYFYFDNNGIMVKNTTIDGKQINSDGYYVINGVIQKNKPQSSVIIQETTQASTITPTSAAASSGSSNVIITSDNSSSSATNNRKLKNNITKKSGIDFIDSKKVNGSSWVDTIRFSGNDSYLKADSKSYNKLTFEAGVVSLSENGSYLITIYVNGEMLAEYDEESINTGEKIECEFDPNSEIMINYSCQAEDGKYLATDSKYLYLRNANFSNKRE